jgi:hypothetical protein
MLGNFVALKLIGWRVRDIQALKNNQQRTVGRSFGNRRLQSRLGISRGVQAERKIRGGVRILEYGWVRDARIAR